MIGANVTRETIFVFLSMAHVTGEFLQMQSMGFIGSVFRFHLQMTSETIGAAGNIKTGRYLSGIRMHLCGLMAGHARHFFLFEVNVRRILIVQTSILSKHPSTVTAGTSNIHERTFFKDVFGKETAAHIIRTTDVALTATGVALCAVFLLGGHYLFPDCIRPVDTLKDNSIKCRQSIMKALRCRGSDLFMA
ncbi:MAG: hypothetical protein WBM78_17840 [Desulfobacterales bacterium]